ncbi:hypothetical protein ACLQ24_18840 [Micromonospora sp. DT4]|uniref:hypothetical protein n=1 Tax=Micromonospora sp. DT4 TaxID=3393438 RepID=UPI003CF81D3E
MRALARLVARADGRGGTVLTELHGETPLLLRQTPGDGRVVTVYVVGGAAGPLAGDDLRLEIDVGPGAPGWAGPAVLGGAPATGSLLVVDPARPAEPATVEGTLARLPLAGGPATLWIATAPDAHTLRTHLAV